MKEIYRQLLKLEFLLLFVALPISFCFDFSSSLKLGLGVICFVYLLFLLIQNKYSFLKGAFKNYTKKIGLQILINLIGLIIITTSYIAYTNPKAIFNGFMKNPLMWITFIGMYFDIF